MKSESSCWSRGHYSSSSLASHYFHFMKEFKCFPANLTIIAVLHFKQRIKPIPLLAWSTVAVDLQVLTRPQSSFTFFLLQLLSSEFGESLRFHVMRELNACILQLLKVKNIRRLLSMSCQSMSWCLLETNRVTRLGTDDVCLAMKAS